MTADQVQRNLSQIPFVEKVNKLFNDFSSDLLKCANDQESIIRCTRDHVKAVQARIDESKKASQLLYQENQTMNILIRNIAEWLKQLGIVSDAHSICSILTRGLGDIVSPRTIRNALNEEFKSASHSKNAKKQTPHHAEG